MATKLQIRNDIAENWEQANPILAQGEIGYDFTVSKLKIGNGVTAWNDLEYFQSKTSELENDAEFVNQTELNDGLNTKQEVLVNQVNIKSIDGNSLLGEGDLVIDKYTQEEINALLQAVNDTLNQLSTNFDNSVKELNESIGNLNTNKQDVIEDLETIRENASFVPSIQKLIPEQASESNQLADKEYVNSSISTSSAEFRGTYDSVEALEAYAGEKNLNDYAFVVTVDSTGNKTYARYKFTTKWEFEYELNNSSFTQAQWDAINSNVTKEDVAQIADNKAVIENVKADMEGFNTAIENIETNYALKSEVPSKTSDIENDSGFITNAVNDLANYYTKEETTAEIANKATRVIWKKGL